MAVGMDEPQVGGIVRAALLLGHHLVEVERLAIFEECIQSWGLPRPNCILLVREIRGPTAEYGRPLVVQGLDPPLEQQLGRTVRPLPRLFRTAALAHHLLDGRCHNARADPLSRAAARSISLDWMTCKAL
jgi:hypothetical protein